MKLELVSKEALLKAAFRVIALIKENTNKGLDKNGQPFRPYSTKPFAMPGGALQEYLGSKFNSFVKNEQNGHWYITKKNGRIGYIVLGGYFALKSARFATGAGIVDLQVRGVRGGGMLSGINIVAEDASSITIGFSNEDAAKLALYHTRLGAGKSRVIRDFFGITPEQVKQIRDEIANAIDIKILG